MLTTILNTFKQTRLEKRISQESLAHYLDITQSSFAKIEKGQTHLTITNFIKICNCLELDPSDFFISKKKSAPEPSTISIDKIFEEHIKDLSEIRNMLQDINSRPADYTAMG